MPAVVSFALVVFLIGGPLAGILNWANGLPETDALNLIWCCLGGAVWLVIRKLLALSRAGHRPTFGNWCWLAGVAGGWAWCAARYETTPMSLENAALLILGAPLLASTLAWIGTSPPDASKPPAKRPRPPGPDVKRGSRVSHADEAEAEQWPEGPPEGAIHLGGLTINPAVYRQHFLFSGSTGSGKTQAFFRVVQAVQGRGGRILAADSGGEFFSRFGRPGDLLLNPLDARSVPWSPFAEIQQDYDCLRIAKAAIPDRPGDGGEWQHYAQSFLAETMDAMYLAGEFSTRRLLYYLTAAPADELADLLAGTPAAILTGDGNNRMLGSVRAIIATYLGPWRYLPDTGYWSIRDWIRSDGAALWITYRDDQLAMLRHLIGTWLDLAVVEILSLPESPDRDLWLLLDELDSLGKVGSLATGLAKFRKYGAAAVLGFQTIAQLRQTYGRETAQTISANTATKLLLRAGDSETAQYFSQELGDQEIARIQRSHSHSVQGGSSTQISEHRQQQATVLPSQIAALPDLTGYLRMAGSGAAIQVTLAYQAIDQVQLAFTTELPEAVPDTENAKNENGSQAA